MMRRRMSLLLAAVTAMAGSIRFRPGRPDQHRRRSDPRAGLQMRLPQSAKRDAQASKPDEAVWILQCESGAIACGSSPTWPPRSSVSTRASKSQDNGK